VKVYVQVPSSPHFPAVKALSLAYPGVVTPSNLALP
jgi:hypothetical protein